MLVRGSNLLFLSTHLWMQTSSNRQYFKLSHELESDSTVISIRKLNVSGVGTVKQINGKGLQFLLVQIDRK